ncbi:sugar ABC transporter ATP-binding protein [Neorhizobium sp. P12A]|uniref:ATP-binding cassette domain-containing protein n=1 Tax=Neorhizobium sp. P12A TaxID=2268027 RepID=UPI0011EF96F3|nr:ATP-binding cassette domain-containing protein [Neorhizobium sp. P12A]KAA0691440.1 sugar ABC transporter ATP-binding protein [Neorhizobium sp. P12A]
MLDIENVSKRYGETVALSDATIAFRQGTVHTILGENGSGKSTMVKLLSGIVEPDGGTMRLDGKPLSGKAPADFQAVGFATVFQEVLIAPDRTVTDNILLGLDSPFKRRVPRDKRRETAAAALGRFAITNVPLDAPAGSLPLAAQQLIVLARAVVRRPRVLILDEVTAALDYADRESVFRLMRQLAGEGALLLFITHRMDEVMSLSDRISILRGGRVVKTEDCGVSTPAELLKAMAPQTAAELSHA